MANRHYSLQQYFIQQDAKSEPMMRFQGGDVRAWQEALKEKVFELLGSFPEPVESQPETLWTVHEDGLIKEKVVFDSEAYASIPAIIIKRDDLDPSTRHRGIICLHGHGPHGKHSTAGVRSTPEQRAVIESHNYDYALQLAKSGFITITPDFRNFGERSDGNIFPGRDSCNVHFIRGLLMGVPLITLHLWDAMKTIDYFTARGDVDSDRIGCIGLSFGGTMTMHLAALDDRIRAAVVCCALSTYAEYAIRMANFCGSQFIPGIYRYADLADLAGLIAPRPLLIESGIYDDGFPVHAALEAYGQLERIYDSAGARERLDMDLFEGGHQYSGRKAPSFFETWL